jgi:hypothetical protein
MLGVMSACNSDNINNQNETPVDEPLFPLELLKEDVLLRKYDKKL